MTIIIYLLIALFFLGVLAATFSLLSHNKDSRDDVIMADRSSCATCNGEDSRCEQECMLEAAVKEIEYFDDEELDRFQGKSSDSYSDEEAEAFRDILYSMRQKEVKDWTRSLTLRGIELPDQVKDEVMMLSETVMN
jgi:hypothetical protein